MVLVSEHLSSNNDSVICMKYKKCNEITKIDQIGDKLKMLIEGPVVRVCHHVFIFLGSYSDFSLKTSRPKASNGQRFPCPALLFSVFMGGSRAAAPIGDEVL